MNTENAIGFNRVSADKLIIAGDSTDDQGNQIDRRRQQLSTILGVEIKIIKWFTLSESASGDFDMQPILKALEYCKNPKNKIRYCFIKSIDRGTHGGATIYGQLKQLFSKYGVQLVDVYGIIGTQEVNTLSHLGVEYSWSKFSPTWITELLEAERARGEVRDVLTRMIGAEIRYVRLGYRVRPASLGYKNIELETEHDGKRVILAPHDIESPWFIAMFELSAQGNLSDKEIVRQVNKMGYKSRIQKKRDPNDKKKVIGLKGGNPLKVKQLQKYLKNPIYAGINTEKWLEGKPIKGRFKGLVSVELFNKANKGKVVIVEEENGVVRIYRNKPAEWLLRKQKDNPLYPLKRLVLCPACRNPLHASASQGSSKKHYPAL